MGRLYYDIYRVNPLSARAIYIQYLNFIIIVHADGPAPHGAGPSAGTVMTTKQDIFSSKWSWFLIIFHNQMIPSDSKWLTSKNLKEKSQRIYRVNIILWDEVVNYFPTVQQCKAFIRAWHGVHCTATIKEANMVHLLSAGISKPHDKLHNMQWYFWILFCI